MCAYDATARRARCALGAAQAEFEEETALVTRWVCSVNTTTQNRKGLLQAPRVRAPYDTISVRRCVLRACAATLLRRVSEAKSRTSTCVIVLGGAEVKPKKTTGATAGCGVGGGKGATHPRPAAAATPACALKQCLASSSVSDASV